MADKIAVLLGGNSAEREVSLLSGQSIICGLKDAGITAYAIDIQSYDVRNLKNDGFQKVFIALHGRGGEDGYLQSILEYLRIPYTGSGIQASAISINKLDTKVVWESIGLPVAPWITINKSAFSKGYLSCIKDKILNLSMPVIVKPINEGSSLGITKVNHIKDLSLALKHAFYYDNTVLVEKWLSGPEYTAVILGDRILPEIRIKYAGLVYDYRTKYCSSNTQYFCPSGLSSEQQCDFNHLVMKAWKILGCSGCGRIDVMQNDGEFYLLEVNTSPGMTSQSLVPIAAEQIGWNFSQLLVEILNLADLKNSISEDSRNISRR
ncbi:MAG: D-alanine--D-alanine ligase [Candidatus Dasytiphilus stammeri]